MYDIRIINDYSGDIFMLHQIQEQRANLVKEMRSIVELAKNEKRNLTTEESSKFETLKSKVHELEQEEQRATFLAEAERRMTGEPIEGDKSFTELESNVSLLNVIRSQMEGRSLNGIEAEYSKEIERRAGRKAGGVFVPLKVLETRVNTTTSAAKLVPVEQRPDQFIEPLRNKLLARGLGVRVLSGLQGNVSIPAYGSGVTSGWVAENSALTPSDMTFNEKTLTPRHVGALSEMSRQLIMQSSPDIEQLLRDDMSFMLAQAIDSALIKGGGTNEPTGIIAAAGTQSQSLATLDWANILAMVEKCESANVTPNAWLTSTVGVKKLRGTLKSATAGAQYLVENGRMAELPVFFSKQVPLNTTNHHVILGDFSQIMLGIWSELDILVNPFDSTAYARGGVLIRAMATCDIVLRQPTAFVIANNVAP